MPDYSYPITTATASVGLLHLLATAAGDIQFVEVVPDCTSPLAATYLPEELLLTVWRTYSARMAGVSVIAPEGGWQLLLVDPADAPGLAERLGLPLYPRRDPE